MSRARKPVEVMSKHLTAEEQLERIQEQESVSGTKEDIFDPPDWLADDAKMEYKRLVKLLSEIDIICDIDRNNLASYCFSFSKYVEASRKLGKNKLTTKKDGYVVENSVINIQKKYADECRKFAVMCGLSVDSRLKVASLNTAKKKDEILEEFGDI